MSNLASKILFSVFALTLSTASYASLITNGSFEQTKFDDNTTSKGAVFNSDLQSYENKRKAWDIFQSVPGWVTSFGNGIELQKNVVTKSQDGQHHVELDSHQHGASNAVMTQTVDSLTIGADYLLEFYYKPRTNRKNDNGINVFWYDAAQDFNIDMSALYVADGTKKDTPNWALQTVMFTATAESMDLSFGSFGKQNTLGGLVDNVSLVAVPEPSVLPLFAIGLGMIFLRRRKRS